MKTTLKIEEAIQFVFCLMLFAHQADWWWFWIWILVPDISMVGYLVNSKLGAILYNLGHHKGVALMVYSVGVLSETELLELAGIILFAHSSMDRIFGYGLKYFEGFKHTHLGALGND